MILHVVMWEFKEGEDANVDKFLAGLDGLRGIIPQIVDMELGKNINPNNDFDAVLVIKFKSFEDLEIYKNHPEHKKVSALCKSIRTAREAVDIEI